VRLVGDFPVLHKSRFIMHTISLRKSIKLVSFTDSMTGELGLGLANMPRNDETNAATEGMLLAHDIIEHVNGAKHIGTIDDELEAMGALWYTRGQWGDLRRDGRGSMYTPIESVASDLTRMFRDYFNGVSLNPCPVTKACEMDDDFRDIIKTASEDYSSEVEEQEHEQEKQIYNKVCLSRMRMGYRKAKAKYEKYGRYAANNLFWELAECLDKPTKNINYDGQQFKLHYGFDSNGNVFAKCFEMYEGDY
jgi:hypothetical protein